MKLKEVLNKFYHVYAINVTMTTCVTTFLAYFTMLSPSYFSHSPKGIQKFIELANIVETGGQ
jgi:hypothetical protein